MRHRIKKSGFTFLEMLIALAIFTILTTVVLSNTKAFNTSSDFANAAENIILALRETQVYGSGGAFIGGCSTCAYGVHFVLNAGSYDMFIDSPGGNFVMDAGESIRNILLGTNRTITNLLCTTSVGVTAPCANGYVSVTFIRPYPDAFIAEVPGATNSDTQVEVTVTDGNTGKIVKIAVTRAGQISLK